MVLINGAGTWILNPLANESPNTAKSLLNQKKTAPEIFFGLVCSLPTKKITCCFLIFSLFE